VSEKYLRSVVTKMLCSFDAIAVENPLHPGTPDVNYAEGWIELKYLTKWPKTADVLPVKVAHFTPQQRIWLRRRIAKGGKSFLLLKVGKKEHLLFKGDDAANYLGMVDRQKLIELACCYMPKGLKKKEFLECLV
jgi:hypothetical protein